MSKLGAQREITARLKTIPSGPGKFLRVEEGSMSDEEMAEIVGATLEPFIVVSYTGFAKAPKRYAHMTGARYNTNELQIVVNAIATDDDTTHVVMQEVYDRLVGFEPTNCGEIDFALFASVGAVSFLGSPRRMSAVQSFVCLVNSDA